MDAVDLFRTHIGSMQPLDADGVAAIVAAGFAEVGDFVEPSGGVYYYMGQEPYKWPTDVAIVWVNSSRTTTARCLALRPNDNSQRIDEMRPIAEELVSRLQEDHPPLYVGIRYYEDDMGLDYGVKSPTLVWEKDNDDLIKVKEPGWRTSPSII